jgi:hypothetical protein
MGYLNTDNDDEKHHFQRIRRLLRRRNLTPDLEGIWEVHGPHYPHMTYQVYVGYAYREPDPDAQCICKGPTQHILCQAHRESLCVVIYPGATFEIEDESCWHAVTSEDRIPVCR